MWWETAHSEARSISANTQITMSSCILVVLILTVQLVTGNDSSQDNANTPTYSSRITNITAISTTAGANDERNCGWWCQDIYGIIIAAVSGSALLMSIFLCFISCCLCRRRKYERHSVKDIELDMLCQHVVPDVQVPSPADVGHVAPPVVKDAETDALCQNNVTSQGDVEHKDSPADVEISDVENCTSNSELPKNETPQDPEDQPSDASSIFYTPAPEDTDTPC
ncbi:uncharacterized protein LOC142139686 isoform X2 [Mixophyes fleayi]|uniref:uncharacterized protein LOC142139686 isoform X2 n=1 Tax=Mixophyes fleayi TaxID=3061075 RepID=UPI003F4DF130